MFKKFKTKRKMRRIVRNIEGLERRRSRSQAALVEAILTSTTPNDADVDYFNLYTGRINELRKRLAEVKKELEK